MRHSEQPEHVRNNVHTWHHTCKLVEVGWDTVECIYNIHILGKKHTPGYNCNRSGAMLSGIDVTIPPTWVRTHQEGLNPELLIRSLYTLNNYIAAILTRGGNDPRDDYRRVIFCPDIDRKAVFFFVCFFLYKSYSFQGVYKTTVKGCIIKGREEI